MYGSLGVGCVSSEQIIDHALIEVQIRWHEALGTCFYKLPEEIESIVSRAYEETLTASGIGEWHP